MAQLPTSFSAPHSNISDGSDLIRTAMGLNGEINAYGNKAFSTITDFATQQANQTLAQTFASNIANGMDPTSALGGTLGKVNSWTSADAINKLLIQRNFEQESLRNEAQLNINKAQERRASQNWLGENEAAEANLLLGTGYNTNNSSVYNQGLTKASKLSDIGKKYVKMQNLAAQQDTFANSAVSRNYSKALTDQVADKKLADRLDADFNIVQSENPYMTKAQVAQIVGDKNGRSAEDVIRHLNMYQKASGQSILNERATYLTNKIPEANAQQYNEAEQIYNEYNPDIVAALNGNTEQNKADKDAAINIISGHLSSLTDIHPTLTGLGPHGDHPATSIVLKDDAQKLISGLVNNPTPENLEEVRKYLVSIGSKGNFVDFIDSNFIVKNGKVTLTPDAVKNINKALGKQIVDSAGGTTRSDLVAKANVEMNRLNLPVEKEKRKETFSEIAALTRKEKLTPEEQIKLKKLTDSLNNQSIGVTKREAQVADTTSELNPIDTISQTVQTFGELVGSGKQIFVKDLTDKGMTTETAKNVIERIEDVVEEAQSSKKYKNISTEALILAVLNKPTHTEWRFWEGGWLHHTDKEYIKEAKEIELVLRSKKSQNALQDVARKILNKHDAVKANTTVNGM